MDFEWDAGNTGHIGRRGLTAAEVEEAVRDPRRRSGGFDIRRGERRGVLLGETRSGRVLVIVFAYRANRLRVVTAYPATGRHLRRYRRAER